MGELCAAAVSRPQSQLFDRLVARSLGFALKMNGSRCRIASPVGRLECRCWKLRLSWVSSSVLAGNVGVSEPTGLSRSPSDLCQPRVEIAATIPAIRQHVPEMVKTRVAPMASAAARNNKLPSGRDAEK